MSISGPDDAELPTYAEASRGFPEQLPNATHISNYSNGNSNSFVPSGWSAGAGGGGVTRQARYPAVNAVGPPPPSPPPSRSRFNPLGGWMGSGGSSQQRQPLSPGRANTNGQGEHKPCFCALAFLGCVTGFVIEIWQNGWGFQPFWCGTCDDGRACNDDGTPCEANILLGPTYDAMVRSGGKLDRLIFDEGEWWRVLTCNWLHGGLLHLGMNMLALRNLGVPLECSFGWWRIGSLYLLSGIFGTMVSVVFLPEVLSVGASASVFGLIGACWADVILNYCARCTLSGANACPLLLSTAVNVLIGLTPFVDNFMHMGGMVAGLIIGGMLFSRKHPDAHGVLRYRESQRHLIFVAALLFSVLCILFLSLAVSPATRQRGRSCSFCHLINCVEPTFFSGSPWWDCDLALAAGGLACTLQPNASTMLCFCTEQPGCDGLNASSPYQGACQLGVGTCSQDDAAWCRDDFCR